MDLWLPPKPAIIRPAPRIEQGNFLPGWSPILRRRSVLSEIAFHDSAINPSFGATVVAPATIAVGDIIVLWDAGYNLSGSPPASAIPSGFTQIADTTDAGAVVRTISSYKLATGAEAGATLTGMSGTSGTLKILTVFRPNIPATMLTLASVNAQATNGNPSGQTITASSGVAPLVTMAGWAAATSGGIDPRTFSPAADSEISHSFNCFIKYKIYNSAPSDISVDMDDEGTFNALHSFYIAAAAP